MPEIIDVPINVDNEGLILANAIRSFEFREIFLKRVSFQEFRYPEFQSLCWSIQELSRKNIAFEIETLILKASSSPVRSGVISYEFVSNMLKTYPKIDSVDTFEYHISVLKTDAIKSRISELLLTSVYRTCLDPKADVIKVREQLEYLLEVTKSGLATGICEFVDMNTAVDNYIEARKTKHFRTTGFVQLDKLLTEGLGDGKITVICGLPGMGKSSFVLSMMRNLSYKGVPTAQFALEMDNTSIVTKLLAFSSNIEVKKIFKEYKNLTEQEKKILEHEMNRLRENKHIFLNDTPAQSLSSIKQQIILLQDRLQTQYIVTVIDLFGKIKDFYGADNFARIYEQKLNESQILARELGVNLCLVAQINREASKRKDYRKPKMSDLKNSGAFEEVADLILGIHRPNYHPEFADPSHSLTYNENGEIEETVDASLERNIAEVIIMKQRMGVANAFVNFYFNPFTTRYVPISEEHQTLINEMKSLQDSLERYDDED